MPHRDIDHLAKALLASAKTVLTASRSLPPFGAEMLPDGEVVTRCSHGHGAAPHHDAKRVVAEFEKEFRAKATDGTVRAAAICMSVTTPAPGRAKKVHAICVSVEHESGEAIDLYCPYRKGWFGRFSYGEVFLQSRRPRLFRPRPGPSAAPTTVSARTLGGSAVNRIKLG